MMHVCGHCNVESIVVQRAIHDDGSPLVLVAVDITGSQRDQVYSCRAAYRVDDAGLCTAWLNPRAPAWWRRSTAPTSSL